MGFRPPGSARFRHRVAQQPALGKHRLGWRHAIQRGGETGVDSHLNDHLDDLLGRAADVQRAVDVHRQLRLAMAERRQRRDGGELTLGLVEARALVDITEPVRRSWLDRPQDHELGRRRDLLDLAKQPLELEVIAEMAVADDP